MSKKKYKKWSDDDICKLKKDYGILTIAELELKYDRKYSSIKQKCADLGIKSQRKKKWTREIEQEFKADWVDKSKSTSFLMDKYDATNYALASKARELGVKRRNRDITDADIDKIVTMYKSGCSLKKIGIEVNCGVGRVKRVLRNREVAKRTLSQSIQEYEINERYFDSIDTEKKAYMYGFFYADGHLSDRGTLSIALQHRDRYILEGFLEDMESNHGIKTYTSNGRKYSLLSITNKHISDTLRGYGVDGDKTYSAKFPSESVISDEMIKPFLRGFFDGDGTISKIDKKGRVSASLVGTYDMMRSVSHLVEFYTGVKGSIEEEPRSEKIYYYRVSGGINVEKFLSLIYKDSSVHLKRKYERYLDVLSRDTNIWEVRRRRHGKLGRTAKSASEKAIDFLLDDSATEYDKSKFIEMITGVKGMSKENISYHVRSIVDRASSDGRIIVKSGYRKILVERNVGKNVEDINYD